ncbi:MAG: hypothetical protein PHP64_04715 [Actinomycetota bacterium]|nr:hypothetical protein [Actinomycetota bacterium]
MSEKMKEKAVISGAAKAMYGLYAGFLLLWLYTGFCIFHPFVSGWRYPWTYGFMRSINVYAAWVLFFLAIVYIYYATLGKPKKWNEPLGWFRIVLAVLTLILWLLSNAVYRPLGWTNWVAGLVGGIGRLGMIFDLYLWFMLLLTIIYIYARWVKSERFPSVTDR